MAVVTVTPTSLVLETLSAVIRDADGVVATSTVDGWNIPMPAGGTPERLLLKFTCATNADTCVVKAGINPHAQERKPHGFVMPMGIHHHVIRNTTGQ